MNKWFVFPVAAAQAWSQQASPEASAAEKALRTRVEEFYQLQLDKKFRQAEAFVAEDTKDFYFASKKPELTGYSIVKVELLDNTKAKVTVKSKSSMLMIGVGRLPIEIPTETLWKLEKGSWVWYVDTSAARPTPFGAIAPTTSAGAGPGGLPDVGSIVKAADVNSFQHAVTIDTTTVTLTEGTPVGTATVTNGMPGFVELSLETKPNPYFSAEIDKTHVGANEKAVIRVKRLSAGKNEGAVHVSVSPLNTDFEIHIVNR